MTWVRSYLGTHQFAYEPVWLRSLLISLYTHSIFSLVIFLPILKHILYVRLKYFIYLKTSCYIKIRKARFSAAKVIRANIYIITNQNRELYSVRPQNFQHGRLDYEHIKAASQIGVA